MALSFPSTTDQTHETTNAAGLYHFNEGRPQTEPMKAVNGLTKWSNSGWFRGACEKYGVDSEGYASETALVPNYNDTISTTHPSTQIILDTARWTCKTSYFAVDPSIDIYTHGQWANPLLVSCYYQLNDSSEVCLQCFTSCDGCNACNACYNQYVDCAGCTTGCTESCTSGCTETCTGACAACVGSCAGNVEYIPEDACTEGCTSNNICIGATQCVNNTAEIIDICKQSCQGGCAESCQTCTTDVERCGSFFIEDYFEACSSCNNCTNCTACNGNVAEERCKGNTSCSGCTEGCTEGSTTAITACAACVNSCTSECQNYQNGLSCQSTVDVVDASDCINNVSCASGTFSCILATIFARCSGDVEWHCENNNTKTYDADTCPKKYTCISETGAYTYCELATAFTNYCKGNCNTSYYNVDNINCKLLFRTIECQFTYSKTDDPTEQYCTSCDSSCDSLCQGCDGSCTGCDGCTGSCQGCASGCTSGCTASCTAGCTTSCVDGCTTTCASGCQQCDGTCYGCTTGCTTACAGGCTTSCASATCTGCTTSCASGCTTSCASGCTGACVSYDPGCTSCVSSCTTADGCPSAYNPCPAYSPCSSCVSACQSYCTTSCAVCTSQN